jgi:hypothetical protein
MHASHGGARGGARNYIRRRDSGVQRREAFKLTLWSERVTARELIERRVRHEVEIYNRTTPEIILSKALLLAADATITDPLIVRQIRPT